MDTLYEILKGVERHIGRARKGDDLGPLTLLPGRWESKGMGWNMIALPFATAAPRVL